jgi:hypothetical protein
LHLRLIGVQAVIEAPTRYSTKPPAGDAK